MAKFMGLAARIRELGGEATMVELRYCELRDETETVARFQQQSEVEYQDLLKDCAGLMESIRDNLLPPAERSERLRKVVKRYGKVKSRDYFQSRSRDHIASGLEDLAADMARVTDEIGRQLLAMLDL